MKSSAGADHHSIKDNDGLGQVYSLEVGQTFQLCNGWSVTPQAQYVYSSIRNDSFFDKHDDRYSYKTATGKLLRVGVGANRDWNFQSAGGDTRRFELYGVANVYREFDAGTEMKHYNQTTGAMTTYKTTAEKWWAGASVGATYDWCDSKYSVYGEVGFRYSF